MDPWGTNNVNNNQQNKGSFETKSRGNFGDVNGPLNSSNTTGNSGWGSNFGNPVLNSGNILNRSFFSNSTKSNQERSSQFNMDDRSNPLNTEGVNISRTRNRKFKTKDKVVSITYEEIGLFPRSFSRVFDRFLKQIFSDVENLVIQEYRFYRYLFLTTIQTIFILVFVPLVVNFIAKTYLIRPITEYFWNTKQTEIFLNSYEQKRAFVELQDFEEKLYFESLLISNNFISTTSQSDFEIPGTTTFGLAEPEGAALSKETIVKSDNTDGLTQVQLGRLNNPMLGMPWFGLISNQSNTNNLLVKSKNNLNGTSKLARSLQNIENVNSEIDRQSSVSNSMLLTSKLGGQKESKELASQPSANTSNIDATKYYLNQSSLFLALSESLQEKTLELAIRYNNHSIEAITNFFADFLSLITLLYLLISLEIQINITKSFLLEVFFGLDDSKKSLLILIMTDLLVGYHSSNLWELFFQFIFNHYGIPESQTGIFLLVATLPVLLDVLFKYLIFRHLNRSSPATVATYHAIIE